MSRPDDICACGHPRSLHTLDQVQRFTDGSARRRSCSELIYDGLKGDRKSTRLNSSHRL